MNIRFNILPYASLRGWSRARRIKGRLVRICGVWFWK